MIPVGRPRSRYRKVQADRHAAPSLRLPAIITQHLEERRLRHLNVPRAEALQLCFSPFLLLEVFHLGTPSTSQNRAAIGGLRGGPGGDVPFVRSARRRGLQ